MDEWTSQREMLLRRTGTRNVVLFFIFEIHTYSRLQVQSEPPIQSNDNILTSHIEEKLNMTPSEVVTELDRFIVGQKDAKRAVAVALRNRWRRLQLDEEMRKEIIPKNILMIGPTGCGKTEIARRLSGIADAPFIKVEATKFTEVGFHGRDVDMIVRDLLEVGIALTKKVKREALMPQVNEIVNTRLLELLVGGKGADGKQKNESFRRFLESGEIEDTEVTLDVRRRYDYYKSRLSLSLFRILEYEHSNTNTRIQTNKQLE